LQVEDLAPVVLEAGPAGPPVRHGNQLLIPLSNGMLARVPLDKGGKAEPGPSWRARRLGTDTPGYVTVLDKDHILTWNGHDGLYTWYWPPNQALYEPRPTRKLIKERHLAPTLTLDSRLTAPPLLVPPEGPRGQPRVCLARADRLVQLLRMEVNGSLTLERRWDVGGLVTAGPFLRVLPSGEKRIGCVVNGSRLAWIDPDRDGGGPNMPSGPPLWVYDKAEGIVGQPQLVRGALLVADQSGRFVTLDPDSGKVFKEFPVPGNLSATVSPVPFGSEWAFAPMTDGTVLLLEGR
jgi:hypothetical protein